MKYLSPFIAICLSCIVSAQSTRPAMLDMPGQSYRGELPASTAEQEKLAHRLCRHVTVLAMEIGERHVDAPVGLRQSVDFLSDEMKQLGLAVQSQAYEVRGVRCENLEVEIKGADKPGEILVVGAHYDSVPGCPAANDNGSGVAAVIEIARALKDARPARTVRFVFFVNEEMPFFQTGEMGSQVYAKRCRERGEKIVGMISVETIGFYSDEKGSQKYPPPFDQFFPSEGNFIGFVGNEESLGFVRETIGAFRKHAKFPSEGLGAPADVKGVGWSDHWSLWQEGYPAIMVTDTAPFRYPLYHEVTDTPDKIDYDRTARVVDGMIHVVNELANKR